MRAPALLLLSVAMLVPGPLCAQAAIEALFSKTEAVTVSGNVGCLTSASYSARAGGACGVYGFGLEALIRLATPEEAGDWSYELALGYGQITGFRSTNPDLDLRGAIRQLPSIAAYASRARALPMGFDAYYFGVYTGLMRMSDMHAYDQLGRQYTLDGETFEFGLSAGLWERSGFFVEPSYRFRYFPGVRWGFPSGVDALPVGWPRALNLTGAFVAVGYQFSIRGDE